MKKFSQGNTYYHYAHPIEEFDRNFKIMNDLGIDSVRVAEIWPGWSVLETKEGEYNFDELDVFVESAGKNGLTVCMGVGINDTPFWLYYKFTDLRMKDVNGKVSGRHVQSACFDHMAYRSHMNKFIEVITKRYADNPVVTSFQLGNEVRYNVDICDCEATRQRFRTWLKEKYNHDIEKINREWGVFYASFDEIYPYNSPEGAPTNGITTHYLATKSFQSWSLEELIVSGAAIMRNYTDKPIFHNSYGTPNMSGSHYKLAEACDVAVIDIYAITYDNPGFYQGLLLDMTRTIASIQGKDFWVGETPAGQYGTYLRNHVDHKMIENNIIEHIGSGVKAVFYFRHKAPKYEQPHKFTGSQTFLRTDESEMKYAAVPKLVKKLMDKYEDRIANAKNVKSEIAMYYPTASIFLGTEAGYKTEAAAGIYGARAIMAGAQHQLDILDDDMLEKIGLKGYKVLILPMAYLIDKKNGILFKKFVEDGGTLISEGRPAYVDGNGWLYDHQPGAGLNELFGADEDMFYNVSSDYNVDIKMDSFLYNGQAYMPYLKQTYRNVKGQPFITDEQGNVCGVINKYGKGKAFILGGLPSLYFSIGGGKYESGAKKTGGNVIDSQRDIYSTLYGAIAKEAGVSPVLFLEKPNPKLTAKILKNDVETLYFIINYDNTKDSFIRFDKDKAVTELTLDCEAALTGHSMKVEASSWKILSIRQS